MEVHNNGLVEHMGNLIYFDHGVAVGMSEKRKFIDKRPHGVEIAQTVTAISGRRTSDAQPIDQDLFARLADKKDALKLADIERGNGKATIKRR